MSIQLQIGGLEFPLKFTLRTLIRMQEDLPDFNDDFNKYITTAKGLMNTIYYLAMSGAALEDKELDVSLDWMAERIPANRKKLQEIQKTVVDVLVEGNRMETEEEEDQGREVDVVLEEIKKNGSKTE